MEKAAKVISETPTPIFEMISIISNRRISSYEMTFQSIRKKFICENRQTGFEVFSAAFRTIFPSGSFAQNCTESSTVFFSKFRILPSKQGDL